MQYMIGSVMLSGTTPDEWPRVRAEIEQRVLASLGIPPAVEAMTDADIDELERYERYGLQHIRLRYRVVEDEWNEGICVLPREGHPARAVLTIHGTNGAAGKDGMLDPENQPARAYGIELAQRGYVTFSADLYGFGATLAAGTNEELIDRFYARYPDWSILGRRLREQQRALDLLSRLGVAAGDGFGAMGNSLGGRMTAMLTALDARIRVSVPSCGLSPNVSNAYRYVTSLAYLFPVLSTTLQATGKPPWDFHELLALCAPRPLLSLEPFNDAYNPDVSVTAACLLRAAEVYQLLGHPDRLSFIVHGDGHDTVPDIREAAYRWFDRFFPQMT